MYVKGQISIAACECDDFILGAWFYQLPSLLKKITALSTSPRIKNELWNVNSIGWCYWNIFDLTFKIFQCSLLNLNYVFQSIHLKILWTHVTHSLDIKLKIKNRNLIAILHSVIMGYWKTNIAHTTKVMWDCPTPEDGR